MANINSEVNITGVRISAGFLPAQNEKPPSLVGARY
jgi:hypothetical protein